MVQPTLVLLNSRCFQSRVVSCNLLIRNSLYPMLTPEIQPGIVCTQFCTGQKHARGFSRNFTLKGIRYRCLGTFYFLVKMQPVLVSWSCLLQKSVGEEQSSVSKHIFVFRVWRITWIQYQQLTMSCTGDALMTFRALNVMYYCNPLAIILSLAMWFFCTLVVLQRSFPSTVQIQSKSRHVKSIFV